MASQQQQQNNNFNDVLSSVTNVKDDEKRKSFTPNKINYEKYHLPSYREQYLIGKNGQFINILYSIILELCQTKSCKNISYVIIL